jgi:hypothetical protein
MARRWVVYPFLFAVYPVVYLFARNLYETPARELVAPVALALAASAAVWVALRLALRDPAKAGLVTVLAILAFATSPMAPGWVDDQLSELSRIWVLRDIRVWPPLTIGAVLAVALALAVVVVRLRDPRASTPYLNTFAALLIALPLAEITWALVHEPARVSSGGPRARFATAHPTGRLPDVYYIVLDGYARTDVMKGQFGFDNEPFLERLERKGFYVARRSTANYCQTPLCMSSALSAAYLNDAIPADSHDKSQLYDWIGDGAVVRTLRGLGYRFVSLATGFFETDQKGADHYLAPYQSLSGFHAMLLAQTPLAGLLPHPSLQDAYTMTRDRTLFLFDQVPEVAHRDGPTFTFAHILGPHPPFVFGPDGEDVSPRGQSYYLSDGDVYKGHYGDEASYVRGYRGEAEYLTGQVERMIDRILATSPEPPVIILQSDHGSGLHLETESLEGTDLRERMSILNAYYLPGGGERALYPSISPVNSFRVVFNTYFGAGLDLLPDRCYYSTWAYPFTFVDVTERVRPASDRDPRYRAAGGPGSGVTPLEAELPPVGRPVTPDAPQLVPGGLGARTEAAIAQGLAVVEGVRHSREVQQVQPPFVAGVEDVRVAEDHRLDLTSGLQDLQ